VECLNILNNEAPFIEKGRKLGKRKITNGTMTFHNPIKTINNRNYLRVTGICLKFLDLKEKSKERKKEDKRMTYTSQVRPAKLQTTQEESSHGARQQPNSILR
jgi:hypothetical protein